MRVTRTLALFLAIGVALPGCAQEFFSALNFEPAGASQRPREIRFAERPYLRPPNLVVTRNRPDGDVAAEPQQAQEPQRTPTAAAFAATPPPQGPAPTPPAASPPSGALTVIGSALFTPHAQSPISPTLAERLLAHEPGAIAMATGNGGGMAILCQLSTSIEGLRLRGMAHFANPDFVLMTRQPTEAEKAACARNGVAIETVQLAVYRGGLPSTERIEGAWAVFNSAHIAQTPHKRDFIGKAQILVATDNYALHFSAL